VPSPTASREPTRVDGSGLVIADGTEELIRGLCSVRAASVGGGFSILSPHVSRRMATAKRHGMNALRGSFRHDIASDSSKIFGGLLQVLCVRYTN
jgi:hypothetical protein